MPKSGIKLFRLFGIDVYLHWAWIIVALYEMQERNGHYSSLVWPIAEYLSLFGIVLMHEFGHALACRSVGGTADRIMLWPLGGVAFIRPPQRPGAVLWSIVAGPLVNVALVPVTFGLSWFAEQNGWGNEDLRHFLETLALINVLLLVFNVLPAYPLDGGQILRALLWFLVGPVTSLRVACVIGFCGAAGVVVLAVPLHSVYLGFVGAFMAFQSWAGWRQAAAIAQVRDAPDHPGYACPACGAPPPVGSFWQCPCGNSFDSFANHGICPQCGRLFHETACPRCGKVSPRAMWQAQGMPQGVPQGVPPQGVPYQPIPYGAPYGSPYGWQPQAWPPPPPPPGAQSPWPWGPPLPPPPPPPSYPLQPSAPSSDSPPLPLAGDAGVIVIPPAEAIPPPGPPPPER